MKGVTWSDKSKNYRVRYEDINTNVTKLENACQKVVCKITAKICKKICTFSGKSAILVKHFSYQDHYFITYWNDLGKPFFDIRHVISVLNLQERCQVQKYTDFKDNIKYYFWHKNSFGGYILRGLVDKETFFNIIFSSQSNLSKSFKMFLKYWYHFMKMIIWKYLILLSKLRKLKIVLTILYSHLNLVNFQQDHTIILMFMM
jgi:hypothetical protein